MAGPIESSRVPKVVLPSCSCVRLSLIVAFLLSSDQHLQSFSRAILSLVIQISKNLQFLNASVMSRKWPEWTRSKVPPIRPCWYMTPAWWALNLRATEDVPRGVTDSIITMAPGPDPPRDVCRRMGLSHESFRSRLGTHHHPSVRLLR